MSCSKSSIRGLSRANDDAALNDMIRRAVRAEIESSATNWMGATATLAAYLDVSPRMIRARCKEELVGASRMKRDLIEGCWSFLEMVAKRTAAWTEHLAREVERRAPRQQLSLALEFASSPAGTLPRRTIAPPAGPPRLGEPANEAIEHLSSRIA